MIKKNKGFTIVELLIASLIGFIVASTAIDLIFSSAQSTSQKNESSQLQQDGLIASILISNDIYKAGDLDYGQSATSKEPFFWENTSNEGDNDTLSIRYYNHEGIENCSGNSAIEELENIYKVVDNELLCNDVKIIGNVERLKFIFGADIDGDGNIDRFLNKENAEKVSKEPDQKIISVSFSLLLKSPSDIGAKSSYSFTMVDGEVLNYNSANSYRLLERTILLRNML